MNDQNQNGNQNSFQRTNNNAGFTTKPIKPKKKTLKEFKQEIKIRWTKFQLSFKSFVKTSKKVFRLIMVLYVIVSAIITATVLIDLSEDVSTMLDAYKRVEMRTENIKKEEIEKEFQEVSDATVPGIKTAQATSTPVLAVETAVKNGVGIITEVTAYSLVPEQTDSTPCVGAANQNLCFLMREKKMNVCAAPLSYPFGTIIEISKYRGSQKNGDNTCVVLDRMPKYPKGVDICMDQDTNRAFIFGRQFQYVTVVGYMENWRTLARFDEPSR